MTKVLRRLAREWAFGLGTWALLAVDDVICRVREAGRRSDGAL